VAREHRLQIVKPGHATPPFAQTVAALFWNWQGL
jgi:hypothetical protein